MKRPTSRPNGNPVVPMAEQPLLDASGRVTPAGRRRSDHLIDRTMERLQREAEGNPERSRSCCRFDGSADSLMSSLADYG